VIIVVSFCFAIASYSQDVPLFKIITFSDGVTVGGKPAEAGMNVSDPNAAVIIPKGGYMGVILNNGETREVRKSKSAKGVATQNKFSVRGSVRADPPAVWLYPDLLSPAWLVVHDSIFLNWKYVIPPKEPDSVTIRFANMFDETISEVKTPGNYAVIDVGELLENEKSVIVDIKFQTIHGEARRELLLRKNQPSVIRVKFDLARLPVNEDRLFVEAALYELDNTPYETHMCLYKIMKANKTTPDPILEAFYKRMIAKYSLDLVRLD
jgi:hypothetical protein